VVGLATVFGAGGGTSSYEEIEQTDCILLWGSNAREAHPIFFHHLIKGIRNGAKMYAVDPRRTSSAKWADMWLGLEVGSDIVLANAIGREIIAAGLANREFIDRATEGFAAYEAHVDSYTLAYAETITKIPAAAIREVAHAYAKAPTAQILWTLGITEHATGSDNVFSLCNLSLLTGHVGRWGSGLVPLRGQNNVQGGGDMGSLPNKLPGFADITDVEARARFEQAWGAPVPPKPGKHLTLMFEAMDQGELEAVWVIGENPADSEADVSHARKLLSALDTLIVSDIVMTRTAELADVVFPAAAGWAETDGTVTSSERRVQRVRKALNPPGEAVDDIEILVLMAKAMGHDWSNMDNEAWWDELRSLSPMHGGMSYDRLESSGGLQWPCPDEHHPGTTFLHARLWADPIEGPRAPFTCVDWAAPADALDDDFPLRLTTGRALDSYNTGVQSGSMNSPIRYGDTLDVSQIDADRFDVSDGERVLVSSRRGSIEMDVRIVGDMSPGLAFTTFHFPEKVDINLLTIDAWDPKSGTAEFKATAINVTKLAEV
jgi:predicted molibdopterin-dependent oxidoreductase YjgC